MPPRPRDIIRVDKWRGVAFGMLFLWQFIIAAWSIFMVTFITLLDQCCEGRPWSWSRADVTLILLLVANVTIFITLLTEVHLFINDKLTVNCNLGIQVGKTIYVGGLWIWRFVSVFQYFPVSGIWRALYALLIQTVLCELPFFIAFWVAIYWKVISGRGSEGSDEEVGEETPLLAENLGAPPAEPPSTVP